MRALHIARGSRLADARVGSTEAGLSGHPRLHPVLESVARLVEEAPLPMALMVGGEASLIYNAAHRVLFSRQLKGKAKGWPAGEALPEYQDLFAAVIQRAHLGEGSSFRDLPVGPGLNIERHGAQVDFDFTPVTDENGNLLGILWTVSEPVSRPVAVSEREGTHQGASREPRVEFETLTEALPQIVWSCGADGSHDYFSKRWSEFTGIPTDQITAEMWKRLVYPKHWARVSKAWDNARRTGEPYDIDYRFLHRSGEYRWLRVMALPIRDESGKITRWCGTSTDVHDTYLVAEERKRLQRALERMATRDQLTDVLTRRAFFDRASNSLRDASKRGAPASVLMMDVDHFKRINDTYGHPAGDAVLSLVAKRMQSVLKKRDLIGRLGGEEFGVLLPGCGPQEAVHVAERMRTTIASDRFFLGDGGEIPVTISIGVTSADATVEGVEGLLSVADRALYQAKAEGRNQTVLLSPTTVAPVAS